MATNKPAPPAVPKDIQAILEAVFYYANKNELGVVSALSKSTDTPRFVLTGREKQADGSFALVPLGYLAAGIHNEVKDPADISPTITVEPTGEGPTPPMDDFTATMIAEGVMEADEDTTLRAWQHLEDTGLGYSLQGWFGRRLRDLIADGSIRKRESAAA